MSRKPDVKPQDAVEARAWTFLTNHAHVLLSIAKDPAVRMRDVALKVGVTERAVQRIVTDLVEAGYLRRQRDGRQNRYEIRTTLHLRHAVERGCRISDLIRVVLKSNPPDGS